MANITFKGNAVETSGTLPKVGSKAPDFRLTNTDLKEIKLSDYKGKKVILNIFPSLDTNVCATSVRKFNEEVNKLENTVVINISKDLPFAHGRFYESKSITNQVSGSQYKDEEFGKRYGVLMKSGPLAGLFSRAVVALDESGNVIYTEQVPEISREPNYAKAVEAVK
jgi:thiol peroxidase